MNKAKCSEYLYVQFLISAQKNFTCTELSKVSPINNMAHDSATRMLNCEKLTPSILWKNVKHYVDLNSGYLIVDDTVLDKIRSGNTDLVCWQYSGTHKKVVKGIGLTNLLWTNDSSYHIPTDFRLYDKNTDHKTKNDHFQEMLISAKDRDFKPIPRSSEFRKKYKISNDEKVILFVGRIHFIKGIEYAIKAVKRLIGDGYRLKFLIVGPDFGYLENLKKLISELNLNNQVLFLGALYGEEKTEVFYNSDVFILSSVSDAFPTTVLEAGYCGLPLVLSEGVLSSEEIKGGAALIVSLDVDSIAAALKRLIDDDSLRLELGKKAKEIIKKNYNSNVIAKKTADVYQAILEKKI